MAKGSRVSLAAFSEMEIIAAGNVFCVKLVHKDTLYKFLGGIVLHLGKIGRKYVIHPYFAQKLQLKLVGDYILPCAEFWQECFVIEGEYHCRKVFPCKSGVDNLDMS